LIIKSFTELTTQEKQRLYEYIISIGSSHYFDNFKEMVKDYIGIVFNYGDSHFSLWDDKGNVKGTLAVITKEVKERGEAFITGVNIREEDSPYFALLLERGIKYIETLSPEVIKLGVYTSISYITPSVLGHGFKEVYKAMIMKYNGDKYNNIEASKDIEIQGLSQQNKKEFQRVHNTAFIKAPNGAVLTDEQVEELVKEYEKCPQLSGICFYKDVPAGIYELAIKNGTGWIDGIAVDPAYWSKGIGQELLKRSIILLYTSGAKDVKLFVVSANERAVKLYEKNRFEIEKITSTWYEKRNIK
jgi:ribosomal protein S18 acetylase RimI-like enzyme